MKKQRQPANPAASGRSAAAKVIPFPPPDETDTGDFFVLQMGDTPLVLDQSGREKPPAAVIPLLTKTTKPDPA